MVTCCVPGAEGSPFPADNLPFGSFSSPGRSRRLGVAIGDYVLDLRALSEAGVLVDPEGCLRAERLNPFLALGAPAWASVRAGLQRLLAGPRRGLGDALVAASDANLHLPFAVADYVDFFSSLDHARNCGEISRPGSEPLLPNWRHLPVGYHGRAGSVVPSGTAIRRPSGQRLDAAATTVFGPTERLDFEAEVGFVVGTASDPGRPVSPGDLNARVFGVVLVNDWSARDVQAWEAAPLGPFLGKSFATSISPWVVPLSALQAARVAAPAQNPAPLGYLRDDDPWALDLRLEVRINGEVVSRPPFSAMYWTPGQQLAHLTSNGAALRTGDLFASGTVSGPEREQWGSLLELTWNGSRPLRLSDGTERTFLQDGDSVTISAEARGCGGATITLGSVEGTILAGG